MTGTPKFRRRKPAAVETTYEVGYGKPPTHTQFKAGESGNPKGRPRSQQNLKTVIAQALKGRITIHEGERTRTVSRMEAIVLRAIGKALQGDAKSIATLIQLIRPTGLMDEQPEASPRESVTAQDEAILDDFLARHGTFDQEPSLGDVAPEEAAKSANPQAGETSEPKAEDDK